LYAGRLDAGRLDARPLDDDRLDEGRRIANHPIAGHRIAGHRDAGHLDGNGGVISYRDANHRNTSYRDAGRQKVVDRVASSRVRALYQLTLAVGIFIAALAPAQAQLFGGDNEARQAILDLRQELSNLRS